MSIINLLNGMTPESAEIADAYDLDATNDYWSRGTDLVGNADGKTFTFSFFFYRVNDNTVGSDAQIYRFSNSGSLRGFLAMRTGVTTQTLRIGLYNSAGTQILNIQGTSPAIDYSFDTFFHVCCSVDMTNSAATKVYFNDQAVAITQSVFTNDTIDWTVDEHYIHGSNISTPNGTNLRLGGHFFFDHTYRDLSVEATRRLFVNENLTPAPIAGLSALSPIILFDFSEDDPNNIGTGGTFSQNGTIARSQRGPSQVNPVASVYDGSNDYLSLAGALTGASNAKTVTWSAKISLDTVSGTQIIYDMGGGDFQVSVVSGVLTFTGKNAGGTTILSLTAGTLVANRQYLIVAAFNMASASNRDVQVNGVSQSLTVTTYTDDTLDLTGTGIGWGATSAGASKFDGTIGDGWFDDSYVSGLSAFYDVVTGKSRALGRMGENITSSAPVGYWPMYGNDAGSDWSGNGNNFTVNSGPYTGARGFNEVWVDSAEFNGSTGYLSRSSALTGANDGKVVNCVFAINTDSVAGTSNLFTIVNGSNERLAISRSTTNILIEGWNSGGTKILDASVTAALSAGTWALIMFNLDLSDNTNRGAYKDGASISTTWSTFTDDDIELSATEQYFGSGDGGASLFDGKLGFFWLGFGTEIDFSDEGTRLKFVDAFNYPVDVGEDGSLPTGTAPILYMNNDFYLGTDSSGNGNDFSVNGTVTDGGQVYG